MVDRLVYPARCIVCPSGTAQAGAGYRPLKGAIPGIDSSCSCSGGGSGSSGCVSSNGSDNNRSRNNSISNSNNINSNPPVPLHWGVLVNAVNDVTI